MVSVAWFIAYVGGGAVAFAEFAAANPSRVPPYMAVVVFIWVVGFFVGHALLDTLCLRLLGSTFGKSKRVILSPTASRGSIRPRLKELIWLSVPPMKSADVIAAKMSILSQETLSATIVESKFRYSNQKPNGIPSNCEKNYLPPHSTLTKNPNISTSKPLSQIKEEVYA